MITMLTIRNFKRLRDVEIPLGRSVVLIGPNNSGKTTALQALALWDVGLRSWIARREGRSAPERRPGVAINRRDLISTPVPGSSLLWHGLHVRKGKANGGGTQNIRIEITVAGVTADREWSCGLEFDFTNEESFVCRPLRTPGHADVPINAAEFSEIPAEAAGARFAFLPPMSGLAAEEPLLQPGRVNVLMGQGQTAHVLRNLCYRIVENDDAHATNHWAEITTRMEALFGAKLSRPVFLQDRGEITLGYEEQNVRLDISAAGRGLQQTLLLLAHLYANPRTVLLLDEPDAHLEILRQREIFHILTEVAAQQGSQIIAASHSEVILNEAASRATVVAFVGKPHRLDERGSQTMKALADIGWDHYYQAEQTGWVLYVEGPTDLEVLRTFARTLKHARAMEVLSRPFVHYISTNLPQKARDHFHGLQEARPDLVGIALFDRLDKVVHEGGALAVTMWRRREIENYLCSRDVLMNYANSNEPGDLFEMAESDRRSKIMHDAIEEISRALISLDRPDSIPWSDDIKASDDFLEPVFKKFFAGLGLPIGLRKSEYHQLAALVTAENIDDEIREKLDAIVAVADKAKPAEG